MFMAKEMYTNFAFQGLLNATLSVDTFFFISGLLTVYTFWRRMRRSGEEDPKIPWLSSTVVRYFRLTPAYAAVIALALIFPLLSSGPLWHETADAVADPCYETWWANLLYVNNFVNTEKLVRIVLRIFCPLNHNEICFPNESAS
jgi:peptidoglycan/LPS O-acetylase OafA/YrhL